MIEEKYQCYHCKKYFVYEDMNFDHWLNMYHVPLCHQPHNYCKHCFNYWLVHVELPDIK